MKKLKEHEWHKVIRNGFRIFVGTAASCPHALIQSFLKEAHKYTSLEFVHGLMIDDCPWTDVQYTDNIRTNSFFLSKGIREAVVEGRADYIPSYLSETPRLFETGVMPIDIAFVQITPPDEHGFCSLGLSVDICKSALSSARLVIAQINPLLPRTMGQSFVHIKDIDYYMEIPQAPSTMQSPELDDVSLKIGKYVSMLIEDGSTIQAGIGKIPEATLKMLKHKNDLGIHSELFTDSMKDLILTGCVTNEFKGMKSRRSITSFAIGSQALYDYLSNNPHVEFHPSDYVNNPATIAQNNKMVAINSAIEVDLTGQVVADSVGHRFYSGIGGQVDFIRGAGMAKEGRPIIALPSTAKNGTISRIVSQIASGAGVVTSRGDIHYVVTEYGIATLLGRSIQERALELIQIAHPDFRDQLLEEFKEKYHMASFQVDKPSDPEEFQGLTMKKLKLKNETYTLRPLHSSDLRRIQEFFYSHKQETLLQRYRYIPQNMTSSRAYKLVNVDQNKDLALCLVQRQGPRESILAIARYYLLNEGKAEVAFVVDEEKQKNGLASVLTTELIKIAKKRKLKELIAFVRTDNMGMRGLLEKFQFQLAASDELDEVTYSLKLDEINNDFKATTDSY